MKLYLIPILALAMYVVDPNVISANTPSHTINNMDGKTQIQFDELPVAVRSFLNGDSFKGWKVQDPIFWVKIHNLEFYEITLKNKSDLRVLRIDSDGNDLK